MIETSNLKGIRAVMIDYQYVTFDVQTYFHLDCTSWCKTIHCLVFYSNTYISNPNPKPRKTTIMD